MAFSAYGNSGGSPMGMGIGIGAIGGGAGGGGNVQQGPDLEDIQTDSLGFLSLSGDSKLQILPTPWPSDNLPPPTASLMSIASRKGLLAVAGPDIIIIATTESVRKAFEAPGNENFKAFQPQQAPLRIPMPMRISQVAFSADESYLVLSAEVGGGLAVYDVAALSQGSTQSAFELSTNGKSLRALIPNPTPEKGELFAVVTIGGELMMANLKERAFVQGPNGQTLKSSVSCLSWSAKGKQLIAGLGNGTAYQLTPEGVGKGEIPKPPGVDDNHHVSSITWLENTVFLMVHTPSNFDNLMAPSSVFHIATKTPPSNFTFQRLPETASPFGLNRSPPHHFFLRLRDFPPNLQDLLIVASTASSDIGLFTRSKTSLASGKPTDVFTMTEMANDSRRAQLPMDTSGLGDTSPIGFALDLSSKETVVKPIPADEMSESSTPLPALMVLNNEGMLASWWIIYSDSVRDGTIYPGMTVASNSPAPTIAPAQTTPSAPSGFANQATSAFSTPTAPSAFGAASGLGQRTSLWGTPSASAARSAPAFANPSFGSSATPQTSAFGTPAFAATSTPAFGSSGFTAKASPWGSAASATTAAAATNSAFGSSGLPGTKASLWGSAAPPSTAPSQASGFASFASKPIGFAATVASSSQSSPFAAASPAQLLSPFGGNASTAPQTSIFSSQSQQSVFGAKPSAPQTSIFGAPSGPGAFTSTASSSESNRFAPKSQENTTSIFGGASNNFKVSSTFKPDTSSSNEAADQTSGAKSSFFGGNFGSALTDAAKADPSTSNDSEMDSTGDAPKQAELAKPTPSVPPPQTSSLFGPKTPVAPGSLFGSSSATTSTPLYKPAPSLGGLFGGTNEASSTPADKPPAHSAFSFSKEPSKTGGFSFVNIGTTATNQPKTTQTFAVTPKIKEESSSSSGIPKIIPEAPLPPDPFSKTVFQAGDSSVSSSGTEAPLPPDFMPKANPGLTKPPPTSIPPEPVVRKITADMIPPSDVPGGPEDEGESDFSESGEEEGSEGPTDEDEGSGEDITKDLSPKSDANQVSGFTPESSFGGFKSRSPDNPFQKPSQAKPKPLFGEVGDSAPVLLPPNFQTSPRSPSPVRTAVPPRMLRPDPSRSVSAPSTASQILGARGLPGRQAAPVAPSKSTFALSLEEKATEDKQKAAAKQRKEAAEAQALVDEDDLRMQKYLSEELKPTITLGEFVAYVETAPQSSMDSIPAQVEAVYRDINSMVDILGLNARTLKEFVKGHEDHFKDEGRSRSDLEVDSWDSDNEWCLVEIENLSHIVEKKLTRDLEAGCIKKEAEKLAACNEMQKDLAKLHAKQQDLNKLIASNRNPEHLAVSRAQPLSAEQAAQQHDLRRDFTKFQKLLSEAEEGLTVLKAKIIANDKSNTRGGPTIDAVMRTITKMTSMAEKRSGDIDVLEGQMRKLRFSSAASDGSREGSPVKTPGSSVRNPGSSSTYGLFYTPESTKGDRRGLRNSLMSSTSSFSRASPDRKKLSAYSVEETAQLRANLARKKEVTDRLRAAMYKSGPRIRPLGDE